MGGDGLGGTSAGPDLSAAEQVIVACGQSGDLAVVADTMLLEENATDAAAQRRGCEFIEKIWREAPAERRRRLLPAAERAVAAAAAALGKHSSSAVVMEAAVNALQSLAGKGAPAELRDAALRSGAFEAVVTAFRSLENAVAPQCRACELAALMLPTERGAQAAAVAEAIGGEKAVAAFVGAVGKVLQSSPQSAQLQTAALSALRQACLVSAGPMEAVRAGCIDGAVAAIRAHPLDIAVRLAACRALQEAAHLPMARQRTVSAGGIEALVAALKTGAESPTLQAAACSALWSVIAGIGAPAAAKAAELGVPALVEEAMRRHAAPGMQAAACGLVSVLAPAMPEEAAAAVAPPVLLTLLMHGGSPGALQSACLAVAALAAFQPDATLGTILGSGGIDAISTALRAYPDNVGLQIAGVAALRHATSHPQSASFGGREAAVAAVAEALVRGAESEPVQEAALAALAEMAAAVGQADWNALAEAPVNIREAAAGAQRRFPASRPVQQWGAQLSKHGEVWGPQRDESRAALEQFVTKGTGPEIRGDVRELLDGVADLVTAEEVQLL